MIRRSLASAYLRSACLLAFLVAILVPVVASAQGVGEGIVIFKDGFRIVGKVGQDRKTEIDSGVHYSMPAGSIYMDDAIHRIYFSAGQVQETIKLQPGDIDKDHQRLAYDIVTPPKVIPFAAWQFKEVPKFDKKWERTLKLEVKGSSGPRIAEMRQRVIILTPRFMYVQTLDRPWDMWFATKELGVSELSKLVTDFYDYRKMFKEQTAEEKEFMLARFLQQAGHLDVAQKHVDSLLLTSKDEEHKKIIAALADVIARDKAKNFADEVETLEAGKQHRAVQEKLREYDRLGIANYVPAKFPLTVVDLRNRYDADNAKIEKVKKAVKEMMALGPKPRGYWLNCLDTIEDELNSDTVDRLDTFVTFAEQHQRQVAQGAKPAQSVEQVLSLAITGWHLGNIASEPDVKLAEKLWKSRAFFAEYMKTDGVATRTAAAEKWEKDTGFPIDVVARLIQHLPPPNAYKKLSAEPIDLDIDLPEGGEGSYRIKLPPDYHHARPHPVLMLLHGREMPELLMQRWQTMAAQHGFILMAPRWLKPAAPAPWGYTPKEHTYVLNCIKDMKRRFNVDSDQVFLYGWDMGGDIAWDFGLAHPDLFAGVLPMSGTPRIFSTRYWPNAQHLPLFAVDGDRSGPGPFATKEMMKDFIRCNFPAYYFEYKGRANELYWVDFDTMMRWMSPKHRVFPTKQLGTYNSSGGSSEEFKSHRQTDNHFYWLSSDEIKEENTQDYAKWEKNRSPARFQGTIAVSNESDPKGNARIVTQVNLRSSGLKQLTVWLSPAMVDFTKPVQVRINGQTVGQPRPVTPSVTTMLDEHYRNVDRQRLFYAKIDLRP